MTLALDIGGTKISAAVIDADGRILRRVKRPAAASAESIAAVAREVAGDWNGIDAAGAIVPGIYDPRTRHAWAPNLWGRDWVPLGNQLRALLPVPVVIDCDRAGYVLGEQWLGAARGLSDVIFLGVGTGIGAGILAGGRVLSGAHGTAGSVGWFALSPMLKPAYKEVGCWEAESAGPALAARIGARYGEEVVEAARRGDEKALESVARTAKYLAMGIANLISAFDPEMIVLGGGLMQAGDLFLEPVRTQVRHWAQPVAVEKCRIELTQLGEDAGLLGAARLCQQPNTTNK
jgi:glucokinase